MLGFKLLLLQRVGLFWEHLYWII